MEKYQEVAINTANRVTVFMLKYADFLKDLLKANGHDNTNIDETFEGIKATLKGKFRDTLAQKLTEKYEPLYESGVGKYDAKESYFDIINGFSDPHEQNLHLIESCLDECEIDKNILDLRVLSDVRIMVYLDYGMNDTEFTIENLSRPLYDSTWNETTYPSEVIEFDSGNNGARFHYGAYRPIEDIMGDTISIAKAYHKTLLTSSQISLGVMEDKRKNLIEQINNYNRQMSRYKEESRIIPSWLIEEEDAAEARLESLNYKIEKLKDKIEGFAKSSNIEFEGGKYIYNYANTLNSNSQPGEDD